LESWLKGRASNIRFDVSTGELHRPADGLPFHRWLFIVAEQHEIEFSADIYQNLIGLSPLDH
jgi:hypothetical protein